MPIASVDPRSGQVLKTFEPHSEQQVESKLAAAAAAFAKHRHTPFAERASCLARLGDLLEAERESLGSIATTEMGKTLREATAEVAKCATACRFYAEHGAKLLADEVVATSAQQSYVRYQPLGVVLAIMPWNFPFWQVLRAATPAVMAGNVMLLKHASNVPQCALALEDLFRRAGFAPGVFQTLLVEAAKVESLLGDSRVVAATLTGSERAGIEVGINAARQVKKVVLELGGSDPFIVMPSADLEAALTTAVKARVQNNGQSCIAAKRFIVADGIAAEFQKRFVQRMEGLRVGDPFDESTELGPLCSASAVRDLDAAVRKSVDAGAKLLTGGKTLDRPGYYYAPTVLSEIPAGSPAYSEELFGPVACFFRAKDAADAVRIANDTRFGLGASVWTNDGRECDFFVNEIQAGMVFVNRMVASDPRIPFGGVKMSGHGRELGDVGIREFTNAKTVWIEQPMRS